MPAVGKELERQTPEEIAAQQLEGYIEKVEKQPEIPKDVAEYVQPSGSVSLPQMTPTDFGAAVMQQAQAQTQTITLPLTEAKIKQGLHHKVFDAIRWVAEMCVYLIKKYPGRVFYPKE